MIKILIICAVLIWAALGLFIIYKVYKWDKLLLEFYELNLKMCLDGDYIPYYKKKGKNYDS